MLDKIIAFYSRNNKNQQFYEYVIISLAVIHIVIISNIPTILDTHPIRIFDIALNSTLFIFAILPIFAVRQLWKINKAARFFLSASPGRASRRVRTGRLENAIITEIETANKLPKKEIRPHINHKIDELFGKYITASFLYMIPFSFMIIVWITIEFKYHSSVFELIQNQASGRWDKISKLFEIRKSKSNIVTNLLWATVALQIASQLAVKAAYSDLRNAVEGWLMSEPMKSGAEAISPSTAP